MDSIEVTVQCRCRRGITSKSNSRAELAQPLDSVTDVTHIESQYQQVGTTRKRTSKILVLTTSTSQRCVIPKHHKIVPTIMNQPTPVAYAVIDGKEEFDHVAAVELDRPNLHQISPEFEHIPETQGISWHDNYFDDDSDIVAVFDFETELMETYYSQLGWACYGSTLLCPSFFWLGLVLGVPCYLNANVRWNVRSKHVAITRDGVKFVQERRPTCWGWSCTDAGRSSKTVRKLANLVRVRISPFRLVSDSV